MSDPSTLRNVAGQDSAALPAREAPDGSHIDGWCDELVARVRPGGFAPAPAQAAAIAGRYRLLHRLGQGGVGEIWCAEHVGIRIDVSISTDDTVYAWYVDGTVTTGTSRDLAEHSTRTFTPAAGKSRADICGIAISKDNTVYSWYSDGTCSVGTATDLGAHGWRTHMVKGKEEKIVCKRPARSTDGEPAPMSSIVGIDIAKSSNNGKASCGTSWKLDQHHPPYDYSTPSLPPSEDRWAWYKEITLQHLFDHKSGFNGSGDLPAAAAMFDTTQDKVTYEEIHRHFLWRNRLLAFPGTKAYYSNHGMGLWTLIIERLTKQKFPKYVHDKYLKPNGLDTLLEPRTNPAGSDDSATYRVPGNSDEAVVNEWELQEVSIAAGGYRASARGLVLTVLKLQDLYNKDFTVIDKMGWFNDGGRLCHDGSAGGGMSTVSMYPEGHSVNGVDLGDVCLAVVVNVSDCLHPDGTELSDAIVALSKRLAAMVNTSTA